MEKHATLSPSEWQIMEHLWQRPHTLMELVAALESSVGWRKSTVATMLLRMEQKGVIHYREQGRTKIFSPSVSREDVTLQEAKSLLQRAFRGSVGQLVHTMAQSDALTKEDIDELYEIIKKAKEDAN